MTALTANVSSSATEFPMDAAPPPPGSTWTVGTENVIVRGGQALPEGPHGRPTPSAGIQPRRWIVERGYAGTTAASHLSGATLTRYYPEAPAAGGGGGSISATDGVTTVDPATSIRFASVADEGGGLARVRTVVTSPTDPGSIGADNIWVRTDPNEAYPPVIYIRDAADTGWLDEDGSGWLLGLVGYGGDGTEVRGAIYTAPDPTMKAVDGAGIVRSSVVLEAATAGVITLTARDATNTETGSVKINASGSDVRGSGTGFAALSTDGGSLTLDAAGALILNGNPFGQAAHVANGSTVDQLRDALIAAGLMAAS